MTSEAEQVKLSDDSGKTYGEILKTITEAERQKKKALNQNITKKILRAQIAEEEIERINSAIKSGLLVKAALKGKSKYKHWFSYRSKFVKLNWIEQRKIMHLMKRLWNNTDGIKLDKGIFEYFYITLRWN